MHPEEIELREARAQNVQKERPQLPEQHRATHMSRALASVFWLAQRA